MIGFISIVFLIPAVLLGALGSIFLKKGAKKFTFNLKKIKDNKVAFIGLFLFGFSTFLYLIALKHGELSVVYPLSSFSYMFVAFFSVKMLKEKMNRNKWIGIGFIILGSFLVVG